MSLFNGEDLYNAIMKLKSGITLNGRKAKQPFVSNGTGAVWHTFTSPMTGFIFQNTSSQTIQINIDPNGFAFTIDIAPDQIFDEEFVPFTDVYISGGPFIGYGRG
jgi:hypothetical protein